MDWRPARFEDLTHFATDLALRGFEDSDESRMNLSRLARTAFHGENCPIGVLGLTPRWEGVAEVWVYVGPELARHPAFLLRGALRWMDFAQREMGFRRLQGLVAVDDPVALRFALWMGFSREGLALRAGPGAEGDFWMVARVA